MLFAHKKNVQQFLGLSSNQARAVSEQGTRTAKKLWSHVMIIQIVMTEIAALLREKNAILVSCA
jgi:hypothetical protein